MNTEFLNELAKAQNVKSDIELLRKAVSIESITGNEWRFTKFLQGQIEELGFATSTRKFDVNRENVWESDDVISSFPHLLFFGGGLYIDPIFPDYQIQAIVSSEPSASKSDLYNVEIPDYSAIDYYTMIDEKLTGKPSVGDSLVFGFRGQAFVTRAYIAGVKGVDSGIHEVTSIENCFNREANQSVKNDDPNP